MSAPKLGLGLRRGSVYGLFAAGVVLLTACTPRAYMGLNLATADVALRRTALSARAGDKDAQLTLGRWFEEGAGLPRDPARACRLYALASRTTGGTMWIYSPPVGKEKAGRVIPVETPLRPGLSEAMARRAALGSVCDDAH